MFKLMILNAMKYMSVRTYVFCAFILAAALLAPQNNTHATKNGADEDSTATAASRINRYLNLLATTADEFDSRREDASLEQTIVSDLCHYFLSLQGGHKLQADKALEHAFQSNVKRSESIYKGRTFAKLLLFFSIDRPGSEVAAFMKRWDPKDIDPSLDLYYAEMAQYEVIPFTDEWIKRKVVEFTKPKADTGELAIGRLIDMLVQLHADIDAKIENSDGSDETRIAIVNKIQTSLWLESTILSSHTSLFLAGRFWDPAPYPYLKSAITTLCKHSSPEGQTRLIELTSAVAQQELNLRRLKGALSLYQLSSILVKAASPQLPRWHYYDVKFRLQVTHIRTLLSQVDVTQVLLEGTEKDLDQIKDKSDRLEMYGFFHRYRGQLYILASRYEQAADDMEKSARAFEQIHHHNAIGSWASLAEAWRGQKEYKKVEEAIRNGLAARDALTGKIPERVLNNECVSLYLAEAQLAWDLKQYSRLRKILNQYQPGVRDVNVRSLMQVLNGVCYLEYEQDYAAAMDSLKDAWAIIGKFKNQNALIVARYLGRCNRELGQVGESVRWFQQALLIDEELRRSARGSLAYWAHLVRLEFDEMTDELFAAAWDQSQINPSSKTEMYRKILYYAEVAKSRALVDEIESTRGGMVRILDPSLDKDVFDSILPGMMLKRLDEQNVYDRLGELIADYNKTYGCSSILLEYVPIVERDIVLLYVMDEDGIRVQKLKTKWSIVQEQVRLSRRYLERTVDLYAELARTPGGQPELVSDLLAVEKLIVKQLSTLGEYLLSPEDPSQVPKLKERCMVIVPHGVLHGVPFSALRVPAEGDERYLIDIVDRIATVPSASVLRSIRHYVFKGITNMSRKVDSLLLVGSKDDATLPIVKDEFKSLEAVFQRRLKWTDKLKGLKKNIREHNAVHFATHAVHYPGNAMEAGIRLTDGMVYIPEIMMFEAYKTRLLTMGACETARADTSTMDGDEVWSISTAFIYAGIPAIVASSWKQEGRVSHAFYTDFYQKLQERNGDVGVAYRHAIRNVRSLEPNSRRSEDLLYYSNPCFWGTFQFIGD